jgi:sec-independent protein translocase protein TatC
MLANAVRSVGHEERLTVVAHLDELRTRLLVSLAVLVVAFGFCFWQNHRLHG